MFVRSVTKVQVSGLLKQTATCYLGRMNGNRIRKTFFFQLRFTLWLVISNLILFLPVTVAYHDVAGWTPFGGIVNLEVEGKLSILFLSHNYHPFRLLGEWTLALILLSSLSRMWTGSRLLSWILATVFIFCFFFQCYYALMMGIYGEPPYFRNEWILIQEVVPVYLAGNGISFGWVLLLLGLFLSLLFWVTYRLFRLYLKTIPAVFSYRSGKLLAGTVLLFMTASQIRYRNADVHDLRLNSQWIMPRILDALAWDKPDPLDHIRSRSEIYSSWMTDSLSNQPDIYLIFIESYGAVPFLSSYIQGPFLEKIGQMNSRLEDRGWHCQSTYSLSPIKGGRSWLAFSSALFGLHIEDQLTYNRMFNLDFPYHHLIRYLNKQGYRTIRMNTMQTNAQIDSMIPYDKVAAFHEFDDWVLFPDIPYSGYAYNSIGGIPDQFALEFVWESRIKNDPAPHFVFFITLDSHAPWFPPPPVKADYRDLNKIVKSPYTTDRSLEADVMDRYLATISYEWDFLEQFILTKAKETDLFILIGDHQPPAMEHQIWNQINDFAVPLHIISRDTLLASQLSSFDFVPGLIPVVKDSITWRHEGVFPLVRHILLNPEQKDAQSSPAPILRTGI